MKLTFWGAAKQVTGSMFLLQLEDEYNILVDCGLDMDRSNISPEDQIGLFPFEPSQIHAVILTHAHIDHSGYIPNLLREGFEGKVVSTLPTYELSQLLLKDAASLNQKKINKFNKKRKSNPGLKLPENMKDLYLHKQVNESLQHFHTIPFNQRLKLKKGAYVTMIPAGHLLGAAHVLLQIEENGEQKSICFSGDIGRYNYPLLRDPEPIPEVDYLVCESTYGNRHHQSTEAPEEIVLDIIQKACVDKHGKLIVPAFSVGRTQAMLYTLNRLRALGKLPTIKVFSDSPLALQSTQVYQKYSNYLNEEAHAFGEEHGPLFDFENLVYVESNKESKAIAKSDQPSIIISSSGMIQGGRIEYHVKENLSNPKATILMIGYAAEGTLGHDLIHHSDSLILKNKNIPVRADIRRIDTFSGHGDLEDLIKFFKWQPPQKLKKAFLVHGEEKSMEDFKETLAKENYHQVVIPKRGDSFEL